MSRNVGEATQKQIKRELLGLYPETEYLVTYRKISYHKRGQEGPSKDDLPCYTTTIYARTIREATAKARMLLYLKDMRVVNVKVHGMKNGVK